MFTSRMVAPAMLSLFTIFGAGCASMQASQPEQLAARNCKAVPADFVNRPTKNPTPAESAEAQLKLSRLAAQRGGYANPGATLLPDLARDCY